MENMGLFDGRWRTGSEGHTLVNSESELLCVNIDMDPRSKRGAGGMVFAYWKDVFHEE